MKTKRLTSVCLWTAATIAGLCAFAQDRPALQKRDDAAPQKPDVTVQVKVVNVPATVRDKHGKIVNNLTKDDFVLEEDSRPQAIRYFAKESDLPLTLGLLVDTSYSQRELSR
jgi:hypothetical protein